MESWPQTLATTQRLNVMERGRATCRAKEATQQLYAMWERSQNKLLSISPSNNENKHYLPCRYAEVTTREL